MSRNEDVLAAVAAEVARRNPADAAFREAVDEVLASLAPALDLHPALAEAGIIDRICEPEHQIAFRVPWTDDRGRVNVNRGFRVQFNSVLGPFKGGIRFHPSVDLGLMKALAFEQVFKNALTGMALGGAKGGADFDPVGRSDAEIMRFCQSFMTGLHRHLGEDTDVPAGDIGVGMREIGYLFGQYKRLSHRFEAGVLTGKGLGYGGLEARREATGYGLVFFVRRMLATHGRDLDGMKVVVSGAGNVAIHAIEKAQTLGGRVVACSDSGGYVVDKDGIDIDLLKEMKLEERGRVADYAQRRGGSARYVADRSIWEVACEVALPCATQGELTEDGARSLIANGLVAVAEGANLPSTAGAVRAFREAGILFAPGKAANAGGVAASALEMEQNASRDRWTFARSQDRLAGTMDAIHDHCAETAEAYGRPGDYPFGANVGGFLRVGRAMQDLGVI